MHREAAINLADHIIAVASGAVIDSGPRDEVVDRIRQKQAAKQSSAAQQNTPNGPVTKTVPV